jgi:3-oxoadipate enol-lactonase
LVLLHGWTSTAALNFFRCFATLTEEYRVIAIDHRGHGRGIRSLRPFRLEDCADDVAALANVLETGPVTAVGYSMGGPVAQLLWKRHPEAVSGLVLCATAARFARGGQYQGAFSVLGSTMALALAGVPPPVRRQGYSLLVRNRLADSGAARWAIDEWARHDPAALVQAGMELSRFDSTGWIGEIDVPTSVVVTELDATVSPRRQLFLAKSIPGARTFGVQGDHRACVDEPRLFGGALLDACKAAHPAASRP